MTDNLIRTGDNEQIKINRRESESFTSRAFHPAPSTGYYAIQNGPEGVHKSGMYLLPKINSNEIKESEKNSNGS